MVPALNTVLKQIDLVCNVVAPILTGYLMTSQGTQITAIVLAGTFAIFAAVSTALLTSVYNDEPSLAQPKMNSYGEKATLMGKPCKVEIRNRFRFCILSRKGAYLEKQNCSFDVQPAELRRKLDSSSTVFEKNYFLALESG